MNRRDFVKLSPAFAGAAVSASLVLREEGKEPVELGVSVLRVKSGDTLVLASDDYISSEAAHRINELIGQVLPGTKALVFDGSLKLEGVLRGGGPEAELSR